MTSSEAAEWFLALLQEEAAIFERLVSTETGDWIVKGFIDIFQNVYTISADTKVVSKLIELMLFPNFVAFAAKHGFKLVLSREQNHYPDMTFLSEQGHKFAVDLKSTYRLNASSVNSMTLGAFTGYFRNRESFKNATYPYGQYSGHFVLGVIYSRADLKVNELKTYTTADLQQIPSVVKDLQFLPSPNIALPKINPAAATPKTSVPSPPLPRWSMEPGRSQRWVRMSLMTIGCTI